MASTITIPPRLVFVNWGITVLTGSFAISIFVLVEANRDRIDIGYYVELFGIFMLALLCVSAICSIPGSWVLSLTNKWLNEIPTYSLWKKLLIHNGIYLLVSVATVTVICALEVTGISSAVAGLSSTATGMSGTDGTIALGAIYTVIGLLVWSFTYLKRSKDAASERTSYTNNQAENA
ncbi:hypothetical protein IC235_00350 [Hymenobacter sp. BT664]|uniref:Uncharacterized protein n=1 Tax=Hymenobacter montanus TaxID=2771359 RepID=A0A927BA35_9BACT|nr:hypothetical protein [Hymenobacter montanus]MBD2766338.1 hypothetical protein [Hymenobacter montanus]